MTEFWYAPEYLTSRTGECGVVLEEEVLRVLLSLRLN